MDFDWYYISPLNPDMSCGYHQLLSTLEKEMDLEIIKLAKYNMEFTN